jgi:4-hydroxybenzoate polyprenyltransferase
MKRLRNYIAIARPNHWFKNVFILPGVVMAVLLTHNSWSSIAANFVIGLVAVCLVTSANYTINEWLDADCDRHHPLKKHRPSVDGSVSAAGVYTQYLLLSAVGLFIASRVSRAFFAIDLWLLVMGMAYNIKPVRTKDKPYLDVLSESVNNPIRLLLGWFIVTSSPLPPSSLVLAYWMGGAFLMAVKRYAELRLIADRKTAGLYRRSFQFYTEDKLMTSILFYAMCFAFFFGVFMLKYRIELLLTLPLFALMFAWYLFIGMKADSAAQRPESLYKERAFMAYTLLVIVALAFLLFVDVPGLNWFLENSFVSYK